MKKKSSFHKIVLSAFMVFMIIMGCSEMQTSDEQNPGKAPTDSMASAGVSGVESAALQHADFSVLKTKDGKEFHLIPLVDSTDSDGTEGPETSSSATKADSEKFKGNDRKAAKMSIAVAEVEVFENLKAFVKSLKKDKDMKKVPDMHSTEDNNRVQDERRNVCVKNIFIYAIKKEPDNDYHIIIGDKKKLFFNVECSGLPPKKSKDYARLAAARKELEDFFGKAITKQYQRIEPPLPVEITGSLFFDMDHPPGVVGPKGLKPASSWEIHPLTKIVFK